MAMPGSDVPDEIMRYLQGIGPGKQVTYADLSRFFPESSKGDLQRTFSHYVDLGLLNRGKAGFYTPGEPARTNPVAAKTDIYYGPPEAQKAGHGGKNFAAHDSGRNTDWDAFGLFDPNTNIYRALVVEERSSGLINRESSDPDAFGVGVRHGPRRSTVVYVKKPDGRTVWGLVRPQTSEKDYGYSGRLDIHSKANILYGIANKMKEGELVLVRAAGMHKTKSENLIPVFEPLVSVKEEDGLVIGEKHVVTQRDGNRILYLPVIDDQERDGAKSGVGYLENQYGLTYVVVNGAEDKKWIIQPEVAVKYERPYFMIGEIQMTPRQKADRMLAQVHSRLEDLNYGYGDSDDDLERTYVIALGSIKPARDAGKEKEAFDAVSEVKRHITRKAAQAKLLQAELREIQRIYLEGYHRLTDAATVIEAWAGRRRKKMDTYVNSDYSYDREQGKRMLEHLGTQVEDLKRGVIPSSVGFSTVFFPTYRTIIPRLSYGRVAGNAIEAAAKRIEERHSWRGLFDMQGVYETAERAIDSAFYWNDVVPNLMVDAEVADALEALKEEDPLAALLIRPYMEKVLEAVKTLSASEQDRT